MTGRLGRAGTISVVFMLLTGAITTPSREADEKLLPNFHRVNEHLYRGGQPLPGGIQRITALKIKTVINLRGEDEKSRVEEEEAKAAGVRYYSVPLPGFGRPSDEQVEEVLEIINDPQNWPVFVHCHHGEDRTGTIIAIYRISHDGWTSEQAKKEAKSFGMSRFQFGMKDYIGDYYKRWLQRPAQRTPNAVSFLLTARLRPQT
jgi:tyrosine-protein phosphatase SIW14